MIPVTINGREYRVDPRDTILEACRKLGIDIPHLCALEGIPPYTSCMLCVVRVAGRDDPVPACSDRVREGMDIETDTTDIRRARETALGLLLSEHAGDCSAPCIRACPIGLDIPGLVREIRRFRPGDAPFPFGTREASPWSVCRVCPAPCEKACRRKRVDEPVAIRRLVEWAAGTNDRNADPVPEDGPDRERFRMEVRKYLETLPGGRKTKRFDSILSGLIEEEIASFAKHAAPGKRVYPKAEGGRLNHGEAKEEAARCIECDCAARETCRLREYAERFGIGRVPRGGRRIRFVKRVFENYVFEPGKCIKCGICVRLCEKANVPYGFVFLGRGFELEVGAPFGRFEHETIRGIVRECAARCPTGALAEHE
jgi:predicted molibdopterin-dependent oxidoreductase YjgC